MFLSEESLTSQITESKLLENKKNFKSYENLLNNAKQNLKFIIENKTNKLVHIYQLDDEITSDTLDQAILRTFLDCNKIRNFN